MKTTLLILLLISLASCNNCPDKEEFASHLQNLHDFYYTLNQGTPLNENEGVKVDKEFKSSINYLEKTTGLKSHTTEEFATIYLTKEDYLADSIQYANWYARCRK